MSDEGWFDEVLCWMASAVLGIIAYALIVVAFTPEREPIVLLSAAMLNIAAAFVGFLVFCMVAVMFRRRSMDPDDLDMPDGVDFD